MPKERTRRYSIEIKDATGRSVWFAAADWTDEERRIAIAQNSRLCGMPDENCFTEAPKKPEARQKLARSRRRRHEGPAADRQRMPSATQTNSAPTVGLLHRRWHQQRMGSAQRATHHRAESGPANVDATALKHRSIHNTNGAGSVMGLPPSRLYFAIPFLVRQRAGS